MSQEISETELRDVIKIVDTDGDGAITLLEFFMIVPRYIKELSTESLKSQISQIYFLNTI